MKKYLVLIAMLLAACGEKASKQEVASEVNANNVVVNLSMKDGGSIVTVKSGDEIEVKLDVNDATGYSWQYVSYVKDEGVISEEEDRFVPAEDSESDVKGFGVYRVKMLKPGEAIIVANYVSDADKDKQEEKDQNDFAIRVISE